MPPSGPPQGGPQPPAGSAPKQPSIFSDPKKRTLLIGGGVIGILVIGLIAILAVQPGSKQNSPTVEVPTAPGSLDPNSTAAAPAAADGAAAVQAYLEALAASDAAGALAQLSAPPADQSLLTNEVLAVSNEAAPISNITTLPGNKTATEQTVQATFQIGTESVTTTFDTAQGNGGWRLTEGVYDLPFNVNQVPDVDLTINGAAVTGLGQVVFPGHYVIGSKNKFIKLSSTAIVDGNNATPKSIKLAVSSTGVRAVRKAAQSHLKACLKKKALKPSNCAMGAYMSGPKVRKSSINRHITKGRNAMRTLKPTLTDGATGYKKVNVRARLNCTSVDGRRWYANTRIVAVGYRLSGSKVKIYFT